MGVHLNKTPHCQLMCSTVVEHVQAHHGHEITMANVGMVTGLYFVRRDQTQLVPSLWSAGPVDTIIVKYILKSHFDITLDCFNLQNLTPGIRLTSRLSKQPANRKSSRSSSGGFLSIPAASKGGYSRTCIHKHVSKTKVHQAGGTYTFFGDSPRTLVTHEVQNG